MLFVESGALAVLCLACGFSLAVRGDCEMVCNPENMMVVRLEQSRLFSTRQYEIHT